MSRHHRTSRLAEHLFTCRFVSVFEGLLTDHFERTENRVIGTRLTPEPHGDCQQHETDNDQRNAHCHDAKLVA